MSILKASHMVRFVKLKTKWALLFLFFTGCMVGPNYQKPKVDLPEDFVETTSDKEPTNLKTWWEQFNDPVLDKFINQAIQKNYDLLIALEKIEETRALYNIKCADLWPEIDGNAEVTRSRISPNAIGVNNNILSNGQNSSFDIYQNFFQVGFDAFWELDFFGRLRRSKQAAFYNYKSYIENYRDAYISLLSEVAKNYMKLLTLQNKIAINKRQIEAQKEIYTLYNDLFLAGINDEIVVDQAYSDLKNFESTLTILQTSLKQSLYQLAQLLGENPETLSLNIFTSALPIAKQKVGAGIPSDLLRRRPDIREAEMQLAQATAEIGVAVADYFPKIALTGFFDFESLKASNLLQLPSRSWSIGPIIDWRLLTFGRVSSNVKAKNSAQKQALLNYKNTIILALKDVESALVAYFNEQENFKLREDKFLTQKKQTDLVKDRFSSGLNDYITFLEQDKNYLDAENDKIDSQFALVLDLISIYKAMGGEW
ncbi:MAG: efflux transporter outer membrane subunit [Chlamydiae bacterium]|nr:efflux transporter outer membrane subunit [Chlamydiota bacterium]